MGSDVAKASVLPRWLVRANEPLSIGFSGRLDSAQNVVLPPKKRVC
jgi:hypothetical protein